MRSCAGRVRSIYLGYASLSLRLFWPIALAIVSSVAAQGQSNVVTYHYDDRRSGLNANEAILTPSKVNTSQFGKLISYSVDGQIYAQPLYVANVAIPGKGTHNVVYVATENDSVYAFDADSNAGSNASPLWHVSVIDTTHGAATGATTVTTTEVNCSDVTPKYGITGTPTIDALPGTMYLEAMSMENGTITHRLHLLDITTGAEKSPGPILITPSVTGTGDGSVNNAITLNPTTEWNKTALLLLNGTLYISFASHCDNSPYHGWLIAYDATTMAQVAVYNTTPNGGMGGIWMSGGGIAADSSSNLYVATGNGSYDGATSFGDSVMKLGPQSSGSLPVLDWFTPYDQATLSSTDVEQGSGGVLLLPDQPVGSPAQHLLVTGGKDGNIYLLNRDNLGHFNSGGNSQVWQSLPHAIPGLWSTPAWWNNTIYLAGGGDVGQGSDFLRAFSFDPSTDLLSGGSTSQSSELFAFPAPTPTVSANGNTNGIVWVLQNDQYSFAGSAVLHAYDATNLANELYNSSQNLTRDSAGPAVKFAVPVEMNGKVYVGTATQLNVYGQISLLASVSVNPTFIQGGNASTGMVTLGAVAPAGGVVITLSSDNTAVVGVPNTVTVSAGGTSATFPVTTIAVTSSTPVAIFASYGTALQSTSLNVTPITGQNFTLSLSTQSVSLSPGGSANVTITATGIGGFDSAISLSCSSISGLTCAFSPQTITPGSSAKATLTISAASLLPSHATRAVALLALLPAVGLLGAVFGIRKQRPRRGSLLMRLFGFFVVTLMYSVISVGCGGGPNAQTSTASPSQAAITVTGTSGTTTQSAVVTVTIN